MDHQENPYQSRTEPTPNGAADELSLIVTNHDELHVSHYPWGHAGQVALEVIPSDQPHSVPVLLTYDQAETLHDRLDEWLHPDGHPDTPDTPDAEADGYTWPQDALAGLADLTDEPTVLEDAQAAVYGDRESDYGHPREDMTRQAIVWTGLLHHKLADGHHLEPEDVARCMVGVKLARDVNTPKRDNRVDGAGYFLCLDRLQTGT